MAMTREQILEEIQEVLIDALGVDDDEVTPEEIGRASCRERV